MQKIIGGICTIGGLIALIYTLINYLNNRSSFSIFGSDVVISEGSITPVIVSAAIMIIGLIIWATANKTVSNP